MRYLILSDLHANLQAFDAVLADAATQGYDQVLVLGDLVGYGADPVAVIDRTLALAPAAMIRGNHDKVCAGLAPTIAFNDVARRSAEWTADVLPPTHRQHLIDLVQGPRRVTEDVEICHGTPFDEDRYVFGDDDAREALAAASAPICLFGHTHVPAIYYTGPPVPGEPGRMFEDEFPLPAQARMLINVGSVGQPRDGDARAAYGILDLDRRVLRLRRVVYDVVAAQRRILGAGLPGSLAARLERGL